MNSRGLFLSLLLVVMAGCAKVPFAHPALPTLVNPNPESIRSAFDRNTPKRFISEDTVIINAPFNQMAALGFVRVDRTAGTFDLMCLNHMGIQLFLLSGDREKTEIRFALPPLMEQKTVLIAIAQDIRNMYLDVLPGPRAQSRIHPKYVLFSDLKGQIDYEFGGDSLVLLQKRHGDDLWPIWRVKYYEYVKGPDGLFPRGMVLDNYRYHYRIVVKNRSWKTESNQGSQAD